VRWAEFLPFVEASGYDGPRWRTNQPLAQPRYLRRKGSGWALWRGGARRVLDACEAASHLTLHEAEAWCLRPLFRVEDSRNRNTGGAGLGLAIAQQLAFGLGAGLKLSNRIGGGLSAELTLP
jgi:hypothetical protein